MIVQTFNFLLLMLINLEEVIEKGDRRKVEKEESAKVRNQNCEKGSQVRKIKSYSKAIQE